MSNFPIEEALKPECDALRADLKAIEDRVRALKLEIGRAAVDAPDAQRAEMYGQAMLAVRRVEDARMRIGKVLQYARDGVSCFDHTPEVP